jgi:UDP-glucuronate 4-epimerase
MRPDDRRREAGDRSGGPRRFLVTGALGAVGAWTVRSLVDRGHGVVGFDLSDDAHRLAIALHDSAVRDIPQVRGDIADVAALERVIDDHAITDVIHLAALQVPFVRADPPLGARVNVTGTINVLEAVRRRSDRMGAVVYASSIAVYGRGGTLAAADHPETLYGVYKRANEGVAIRYFEDYGVSSIGIRPHTVYGPGRDQGLTAALTLATLSALTRTRYHIPFGGSVRLQYAPDVGHAFARAAELQYEGAASHDLDGPVVAVADLIAAIEMVLPDAAGLITAEATPLPFPSDVDTSAAVQLLGGSTMRPAQDGITDTIRRFKALVHEGVIRSP